MAANGVVDLFDVADPIKASTPAALERLRVDHVRIVMLTGDNRKTAQAVAAKLGIADIEAEVLAEQKNRVVRPLRGDRQRRRDPGAELHCLVSSFATVSCNLAVSRASAAAAFKFFASLSQCSANAA